MIDSLGSRVVSISPQNPAALCPCDRTYPAGQSGIAFVTVPAVITEAQTIRRRLLPVALAAAIGAIAVSGCGEKSEPAVHAPTTAPTTTAPPATTTPSPTTTAKAPTPTAPVPKTTP